MNISLSEKQTQRNRKTPKLKVAKTLSSQQRSPAHRHEHASTPFSVALRYWKLKLASRWRNGKESTSQWRRLKRHSFDPWVGKIPWRRKQQPTPVFLPGKFNGLKSLVGYSPWGHKKPDPMEQLNMHTLETHIPFITGTQLTVAD